MDVEARFYKQVPVGKVRCVLCPNRCNIANGKTGICKVRYNKDGILYSKIYGEVTSYNNDPVEKKPLYHFYPGKTVFSIGTWGCNLKCTFCQNWSIAHREDVETEHFEKEGIIELAKHNDSIGIAYTYNEPTIWYEFVYDTAVYAKDQGLKNVFVTNGFISEEPLRELAPYIDAMNIDLKAGGEQFYREVCLGQLAPVMRTIKIAKELGIHVELTNLVIPTMNDKEDIDGIIDWVASVDTEIPVHFTRYFPHYKMDIEPTELESLEKIYEKAKEKLKYVYLGNITPDMPGNNTNCPKCDNLLIARDGFAAEIKGLDGSKCGNCGEGIKGVF